MFEDWTFEETMENIAKAFEAFGVAIIVIGGPYALVAADIIKTVTVDPNLEAVAVLALLVTVRIALSFSLDLEIDGVAPWRKREVDASPDPAEAAGGGDVSG